ncbi:lipopolysaccharide export system protein LptC [Undibacterium sp. GrIS 1.8]|uniref:LPS export ABC transporter periplasmic protein LptC n=1 Tax=unclassified Undibacterium TaxID=2630295 RepID=UPI00339A69DE
MKYIFSADRFRVWVGIIMLGVIAMGSFWVLQVLRKSDEEGNMRSAARTDPDYYVENFNFIRLSNKGQANFHVTGSRLTHNPQYDNFEITQPRINSFDKDKTPVTVRADRGLVEQKTAQLSEQAKAQVEINTQSDEIHLYDNVQVVRPESDTTKYMQLNTDYLLLLPDLNTMKTDHPVTLYSQNSETHAVGMTANNETQETQLLSQVHMHFTKPGAKSGTKQKTSN